MRTCLAPDPHTKTPKLALPANACDAHCHVFGPADRFPYHPNRNYTPPDAPVENLRALHAILGIDRVVVVQATCHGTNNSAMLDAIASSEGRYRGVAMVDGTFTEADFETLHAGGVRGVRYSYARHIGGAPDFTAVMRTAGIMAPLGWHLVLYLEAEDVVEHIEALRKFPVPVVIDHMARVKTAEGVGQKPFQLLLDLLRNADFWVKVSCAERLSSAGPPYADMVPFAAALIEAAPDRILWGTDWPHPNMEPPMPNDGDLVDLLALYAPDGEMRRRILVDNPARLYGFDA